MNKAPWSKKTLLVASAALVMAGSPAMAQSGGKNERQYPGQLDSKSPKKDDQPYLVRTLPFEAGKRYSIGAESSAFDPALRISFADDNDETIVEDDDGGEGTNSYIEFVPQRTGTYRVRVSSVNSEKGSFVIKVKDLPPLPAPVRPSPTSTSTISLKHYAGELTSSDGEIRGRPVDDYVFRFEGGKPVFIFMDRDTENLDPVLEVYSANDRYASEPLSRDDDGGDELNAFINFTPKETGDYIVRATSAGDERKMGRYRLRVGQ